MEEIKVTVVKYPDRENLVMRYIDPMSGRQKTKSAGTTNKRQAERKAAKWEAELREGRYHAPSRITWEAFKEKYEDEVLSLMAPATREKVLGVFARVDEILNPRLLRDLTPARMAHFLSEWRKQGRSPETIRGGATIMLAAFRRAVNWGMLPKVPKFESPKRVHASNRSKGRPITLEEFERMLALVPKLLTTAVTARGKRKPDRLPSEELVSNWQFYLRGLWLSGLRLAESLELYWDREDKLMVDLTAEYGIIRIPAELEKGKRDREYPMAPEFEELLRSVPEADRTGPVFKVYKPVGKGRMTTHQVGVRIGELGRMAGIIVKRFPSDDPEKPSIKYATAHDLRRSFGDRWARRRIPTQELMVLMRHESIQTTLTYYRGLNAQASGAIFRQALEESGNNPGNTQGEIAAKPAQEM